MLRSGSWLRTLALERHISKRAFRDYYTMANEVGENGSRLWCVASSANNANDSSTDRQTDRQTDRGDSKMLPMRGTRINLGNL